MPVLFSLLNFLLSCTIFYFSLLWLQQEAPDLTAFSLSHGLAFCLAFLSFFLFECLIYYFSWERKGKSFLASQEIPLENWKELVLSWRQKQKELGKTLSLLQEKWQQLPSFEVSPKVLQIEEQLSRLSQATQELENRLYAFFLNLAIQTSQKDLSYHLTEEAKKLSEDFARLRKEVLAALRQEIEKLEEERQHLLESLEKIQQWKEENFKIFETLSQENQSKKEEKNSPKGE